jgi:L-threonylcarbamoyladenylate synthase
MPNTPILPATPDAIARAADVIRAGGLVAFPTETVYGLGADATQADAVARIFTAKQRPLTDPVIVHLAGADEIARVSPVRSTLIDALAQHFMPGALTLIVPRGDAIPPIVSAGRETVALRVPAHPIAHALIAASGVPIAAPSANRFSRPSATAASHVRDDLDGRIDLVLDGGSAPIGVESTILDLTTSPPTLRRPGGVPIEALRALIPDLQIAAHYLSTTETAPAPGQLLKHYSPSIPVHLYTSAPGTSSAALAARFHADLHADPRPLAVIETDFHVDLPPHAHAYPLGAEPETAGARLFELLRLIEHSGAAAIYIAWTRRDGLGAAVWDRLVRAAEGRVMIVKA